MPRTPFHRKLLLVGFTLLLSGLMLPLQAQFYTGSGMNFGRKRVQYEKFIWMYYRFEAFDVYFTAQGRNLALYTANYVQNHLGEMEERIGFQTQDNLRFIVFNRLTDLKQSNIGYLDETTETTANTGGITRFLDNKIFLYFEGSYLEFERQIRRGMAELLVNQAITGVKVGSQYKNSYVMDLPRWFTSGAASYFSREWDAELDEKMAVAIHRKGFRWLAGLEGEDAVFAGHSFWHYIAETYGEDAVVRCIRSVSTEKNMKKTFRLALGDDYNRVMDRWFQFYVNLYGEQAGTRSVLQTSETPSRLNRPDHIYQHYVLNPAGPEAAYVSNHLGWAKVWLQIHNRRFCIYRSGASVNDNPDYSFPLVCFHPSGNKLGLMVEEKGRTTLIVYDIERNDRGEFKFVPVGRETTRYHIDAFDKVTSFSFSPDGRQIVLAATLNGYPDIYLYRLGAGTRRQLTFDLYDDYDPVWIPGTDLIVFGSNRPDDSIRQGEKFEIAPSFSSGGSLFVYDLKNPAEGLFRMTNEDFETWVRQVQVLDASKGEIAFTHNRYGQTNVAVGHLGKTIAHIDTAVHFRHTFSYENKTDFEPGLQEVNFAPSRDAVAITGQLVGNKAGFLLGLDTLDDFWANAAAAGTAAAGKDPAADNGSTEAKEPVPSPYKKKSLEKQRKEQAKRALQDSLMQAALADTSAGGLMSSRPSESHEFLNLRPATPADNARITAFDLMLYRRNGGGGADRQPDFTDTLDGAAPGSTDPLALSDFADTLPVLPKIPPKQHMYEVEYMINSSTAQLGFDYLNACYQQFTGSKSPIYLNSTASGFTQISVSDLMENHRLIGGFSFSLDFSSTEYLFSYEYLERRLGHQIILHMSNLKTANGSEYPYKQNTYDAYYVAKYPLTPVLSLRGTAFGRYDRSMYRAIDYRSLTAETRHELRLGLKGELVYDHSRLAAQNIYYGTRGKVWLEYYQGVLNNKQNLFVTGIDIRDYRRLYKTLIWANRVAFSTSFGQQKLIYYMGGVDSWIGAGFNRDVEVDPNQNYAYQTLATNMRGFKQNIRNGNTFAVINSEIRFPFMQVLSRRPVQSALLRNLQLVVFADVGSAWTGWNPWSKDNLFYKKTIEDGKLTIVLDKDANPIVGGFGAGLRIQLFGYFLRGDLAWGAENGVVHKKPVFYFSLSTDF